MGGGGSKFNQSLAKEASSPKPDANHPPLFLPVTIAQSVNASQLIFFGVSLGLSAYAFKYIMNNLDPHKASKEKVWH